MTEVTSCLFARIVLIAAHPLSAWVRELICNPVMGGSWSFASSERLPSPVSPVVWLSPSVGIGPTEDGQDLPGSPVHRGLDNPPSAHHCFLNVCIQALWHLTSFRRRLLAAPHAHSPLTSAGDGAGACITCALQNVYAAYAHGDNGEIVPPDALRAALATVYTNESAFGWGGMADAGETLLAILNAVHAEALRGAPSAENSPAHGDAADVKCTPPCAAHACFEFEYFSCNSCPSCFGTSDTTGVSRDCLYLVYVADVMDAIAELAAADPRTGSRSVRSLAMEFGVGAIKPVDAMAVTGWRPSLGALLSYVAAKEETVSHGNANTDGASTVPASVSRASQQSFGASSLNAPAAQASLDASRLRPHDVPSATNERGFACHDARSRPMRMLLGDALPRIFAFSLVWPSESASRAEVEGCMLLLGQALDLRQLFCLSADLAASAGSGDGGGGASPTSASSPAVAGSNCYRLRGFICYYGRHYICFMYSSSLATWLIFDDRRVGKVGTLADVCRKCVDSRYQPTVVFYEQEGSADWGSGSSGGDCVTAATRTVPATTASAMTSPLRNVAPSHTPLSVPYAVAPASAAATTAATTAATLSSSPRVRVITVKTMKFFLHPADCRACLAELAIAPRSVVGVGSGAGALPAAAAAGEPDGVTMERMFGIYLAGDEPAASATSGVIVEDVHVSESVYESSRRRLGYPLLPGDQLLALRAGDRLLKVNSIPVTSRTKANETLRNVVIASVYAPAVSSPLVVDAQRVAVELTFSCAAGSGRFH